MAVNEREIDVGQFAGVNAHGGFEIVVALTRAVSHEQEWFGARQLVPSYQEQIIGTAKESAEPQRDTRREFAVEFGVPCYVIGSAIQVVAGWKNRQFSLAHQSVNVLLDLGRPKGIFLRVKKRDGTRGIAGKAARHQGHASVEDAHPSVENRPIIFAGA